MRKSGIGLGLACCLLGWMAPALGWVLLEDLKDPFEVTLTTPLDGHTALPGDPFQAVLADDLHYGKTTTVIPKGTVFAGHVADSRTSKRFGRSGYLVLAVDQVSFPNGDVVEFSVGEFEERDKKVRHEQVMRNKKYRKIRTPLTVVGLVTSLPVTLAVRGTTGVAIGLTDKDHPDESKAKRIGRGLYQASPLPTVVNFVKKQPTPVFKAGDPIHLHMPPEALGELFGVESAE